LSCRCKLQNLWRHSRHLCQCSD